LEFPSYVLILISKRHFQENPIFLQINKELLIESSKAAVRLAFEFFLFSGYVVEAVKRIARSN